MYLLDKIKSSLARSLNKVLGSDLARKEDLGNPPDENFGDLSLPCFSLAKKLKKAPEEIAGQLAGAIKNNFLAGARAAGPYLNFTLNKARLAAGVIGEIEKAADKYGQNKDGRGKRVMIEYSNVNTHKEYHVGHLRNICYGDAVAKILSANGYKIIPVSYINDFGIHTAKTLWAFLEFYKGEEPAENKGYFLGKIYVRAAAEMEKNKLARQLVNLIMKKIESRQGEEYELWRKTRKWSMEQFAKIYQELNVKFSHTFYESEYIEKGRKMVNELLKKKVLVESEGAVVADLKKYNLAVLVFLRSDGTALYPVADLSLAREKFKKFKAEKSIYVVDTRQSLYFKQLFKVLELLGYQEEMAHLGYDFVKLPSGMMSSRSGRVITYEDLRAEALKRARSETKERHKDWSEKKINEVAVKIVSGALKFEMVKVSALSVITFDIDQALRFDGFTAAYLQYTGARIRSVIRKGKVKTGNMKDAGEFLKEEKEAALILKLARYPEAVAQAGAGYDPSEIAKYLFELAQLFNDYYHNVPVIKAEEKTRAARLALLFAVKQTINNGLELLGIEAMEEM